MISFNKIVSLRAKIIGLTIFPILIFLIIISVYTAFNTISEGDAKLDRFKTQLTEEKKVMLQNQIDIAYKIIEKINQQIADGTLSKEEAIQSAGEMIKHLRYGKTGYFWIHDFDTKMVMHPTNPKLDGKDLTGYKDPNGVKLFVEMTQKINSKGSGFVPYMWPKPGSDKPQPKLSFVKGFKPWGWIFGTGIYIDDIDRLIEKEAWPHSRTIPLSVWQQHPTLKLGFNVIIKHGGPQCPTAVIIIIYYQESVNLD